MDKNFFIKSHGLGNDYIVIDSENITFDLNTPLIKLICDYHFGIGSDGILLKVPSSRADFGLRIFNPDASEAEKSGNGLRIFSKFLFDYGYSTKEQFSIETKGGIVEAGVIEKDGKRARIIQVDMGKAIFKPSEIPVLLGTDECIDQPLIAGDREFRVNCVSVGNPHCVIIKENLDEEEILKYGPLIENHQLFPNRINVQFAMPVSNDEVKVLIWERGAGYTLASGSSSCAVACIMRKRNLTGNDVTIKMKGGNLRINIDDNWNIRMTGEVREVASGTLSPELLDI
jgi:diaminopimelate epimerase